MSDRELYGLTVAIIAGVGQNITDTSMNGQLPRV